MTYRLDDYQADAAHFAVNYDIQHLLTGLFEEAGEVAGLLKRIHRGDPGYPSIKDACDDLAFGIDLSKELGDVLWYVAMAARCIGYDLSEIALGNIDKLEDRKQRNVIQGSGDDR